MNLQAKGNNILVNNISLIDGGLGKGTVQSVGEFTDLVDIGDIIYFLCDNVVKIKFDHHETVFFIKEENILATI